MKRILISVVCGVLIVCLMFSLWCIQNVVKEGGNNTNTIRGIYMEEPNSLDMIYIGGSAAMMFFSPLQAWHDYGLASYVYGNGYLCPQVILPLMKEASRTQSPKLWLIDVRPFQYGMLPSYQGTPCYRTGVYNRMTTTGMHPLSLNKAGIIWEGIDFFQSLDYHFDLLFYRNNFEGHLADWKRQYAERGDLSFLDWNLILKNETKHPLRGFVYAPKRASLSVEDYSAMTEETPLDPVMQGYLDELLAYCKEHDQQVLFIVHSYAQTEEDKRLYNGMQKHIEASGFGFLNTNDFLDRIGYDFSLDFGDFAHTNIFGAEKYTDFVAKYILEHYDLPDHRDDAAYADWDACYADYVPAVEETKQTIRDMAAESAE